MPRIRSGNQNDRDRDRDGDRKVWAEASPSAGHKSLREKSPKGRTLSGNSRGPGSANRPSTRGKEDLADGSGQGQGQEVAIDVLEGSGYFDEDLRGELLA